MILFKLAIRKNSISFFMKICIQPAVFEKVPGLKVLVIIAKGMSLSAESAALVKDFLAQCWKDGADACSKYPNVQSHPHVAAWRQCYQALGISVKKYTSSVENLLKRAVKQPEPRSIHSTVDLYNAISVRYLLPFGAFDVHGLPPDVPLELRFSQPGDVFLALDAEAAESIPSNEVVYAVGNEIITRHINWKQSKLGLVQEHSVDVIFMAEILPEQGVSLVEANKAADELCQKLRDWFRCRPERYLLDQEHHQLELE